MTTTTKPPVRTESQPIAFRCSKCFQLRCSDTHNVGRTLPCDLCGNANTVPDATPERIAQGIEFLTSAEANSSNQISWNESEPESQSGLVMSDEEIMKHCRSQTLAKAGPGAVACTRLQRFLGVMIDGFVAMIALILGGVLASHLAPPAYPGAEPSPYALALVFLPVTMLTLIQIILTCCEGRSIGKYCLNMKIVDAEGNPPGFVRGFLLRIFVNGLLGILPLYGLIDAIWIFTNDSKQCLHDLIAGTHVIEASY